MFEGGRGTGKGEFDSPTGIAVDRNGNFLVADTNNGRIEKFAPAGTFLDAHRDQRIWAGTVGCTERHRR